MDSQYHIQLLTETLGSYFSQRALEQIIAANLGQDALRYQLGAYPHFHFDNNLIARSLSYIDEEHERIGALVATGGAGAQQRAAFGRLTHAAHDFYAHSNYVDLWLEVNEGMGKKVAHEINGLDLALLNHPRLVTGSFLLWFDTLYYVPGMRSFMRKLYLRPGSHEAMNLDNPGQGPKFAFAMEAAKQRTLFELERAIALLRTQGGEDALQHFYTE